MTKPQDAARDRVDWIDGAKGVMIVLVVFGHAWRGLHSAGLIAPDLFAAVDARIYAFHMPVFFALSGWFFLPSLDRQSVPVFLRRRALRCSARRRTLPARQRHLTSLCASSWRPT